MQEFKVKNIIIGRQFDNNENLQKIKEIIKEKKIRTIVAESGMQIKIEKDLYFDVLWPNNSERIEENSINNNALVCKLNFKKFNMLFTGDIEEEAERKILALVPENLIKAQVLKVGHHGSKSSSTEEFIKMVNPKIALIGVGENNKYGHPDNEVIERFKKMKCDVYRTDEVGEINLSINSDGKIKKCSNYVFKK